MQVITYILMSTLFSFGWSNLFNENMIFERIGAYLAGNDEKKGVLPEWLHKPLFSCPVCNSVWVTLTMAVAGIISFYPWWHVPLIALSASGLAAIIAGTQNRLKDIADVIEEHE